MFDRAEAITKLESIRKNKMITHSDMIREIGISWPSFTRFVEGKEMQLMTLRKIKNYIEECE